MRWENYPANYRVLLQWEDEMANNKETGGVLTSLKHNVFNDNNIILIEFLCLHPMQVLIYLHYFIVPAVSHS